MNTARRPPPRRAGRYLVPRLSLGIEKAGIYLETSGDDGPVVVLVSLSVDCDNVPRCQVGVLFVPIGSILGGDRWLLVAAQRCFGSALRHVRRFRG